MMQPIAIDVARSVCASVCHKMAKLIKVRAGLWTRKGPRKHVLGRVHIPKFWETSHARM